MKKLTIWLADDDEDDGLIFQKALEELDINARVAIMDDGEQLMHLLNQTNLLPDILFLDLNMPRKNGFSCLREIKMSDRLKSIPVIILSTSLRQEVVDQLFENEARHYIRKPNDLQMLRTLLCIAINNAVNLNQYEITKEQFVLSGS